MEGSGLALRTANSFIFILFIAVALRQSVAYADMDDRLWVGVSAFGQSNLRQRTSQNEVNGMSADLQIGWQAFDWVYFGVTYSYDYESVKTAGYAAASDNSLSRYTRSSIGPTLGFVSEYGFLLYTPHVFSSWRVQTKPEGGTQTEELYKGSGSQIDGGILLPLGPVLLGPKLSYKQFRYTTVEGSAAGSHRMQPGLKQTQIDPMLTAWMRF